SEHYDPKEYNQGTVWPFVTGLAALADFEVGRADAGLSKIRSVVAWTFSEALGRTPEVISGARARSLDASVPHQICASLAVAAPVGAGILGLEARLLDDGVELRPCFPDGWTDATLENARVGGHRLTIRIQREGKTYRATVDDALGGASVPLALELKPRNGDA